MSKRNLKAKNPSGAWWSKLNKFLFWWLIFLLPSQFGKHFWFDFSYVLGLRIDYLSPTLYLTDILVVLILILWSIERRLFAGSGLIPVRLLGSVTRAALAAGFIFLILNCLSAANRPIAFYKFLKIIELFFLGLYVAKNRFTSRFLLSALSLSVIYTSLLAISQFFHQSALGGWFYWLGERQLDIGTPGVAKFSWFGRLLLRPYATFSHPNSLAGYLAVALTLSFGKKKIWRWPVLVLGLATIFLSFSRAVWVAESILAVVLASHRALKARPKARLVPAQILFFLSPSFLQRWESVQTAWQMVKAKPFIGIGLGNFVVRLPDFSKVASQTYWLQPVHNLFLLVVAETGLIGLGFMISFLTKTIRRVIDNKNFLILDSIFLILATGLFDHYWLTLQQNQLLLAIVFGLAWQPKAGKI